MIAYAAILRARFVCLLQYRSAAVAGIATQLFWGLIRMMIFEAFVRHGGGRSPMTERSLLAYVWLGQAFIALQIWQVDSDVRAMVRSGSVAYELTRPLDLYWHWFVRGIAARGAPTVLRCVPILAIAGIAFGLPAPQGPAALASFAASMMGALLVASACTTIMSISILWTISGEGVARLVPTLGYVLSGMIVPLPMLPGAVRAIVEWLPFAGIADTPFRLYSGDLPAADAPWLVARQILWAAMLILAGRLALSRGIHRMVVQGG